MKNLLFVSIAFPPKNDPESLQAAKYFKYLVRENLSIDVVTSKLPTLWMEFDKNLEKYIEGIRQMIEIPIFEPKYLSILVNKKKISPLRKPDTRFHFHLQWKKVVKQLREKPDVLYSRAFPLSSNLMALKLKKHYKIPWILHLSDPWADSPLFNYNDAEKKYHEKFEKECFESADKISFTSSHTINSYKKKYPKLSDKYIFCPNVYDDDDVVFDETSKNDKMQFLYTGSLNGSRSVKYIAESVEIIKQQDPEILNKIEFLFAGSLDRENSTYFQNNNDLKHIGLVSFEDVKKLQRSADVLLAIDFLFERAEDAVFFPSKILDYLITGNPILAITTQNSMTYDVVNNRYGKCFSHNDASLIAAQISDYFEKWKENKLKLPSNKLDSQYSAKENAKKLYQVIEEL